MPRNVIASPRTWRTTAAGLIFAALLHVGIGACLFGNLSGDHFAEGHQNKSGFKSVLMLIDGFTPPISEPLLTPNAQLIDLPLPTPEDIGPPDVSMVDAQNTLAPSSNQLRASWASIDPPSEALRKWREAVSEAVTNSWTAPNGMGVDSTCRVQLVQNNSGAIIVVKVLQCSSEDTVRSSLVNAIFRATSLPPFPAGESWDAAEVEFQLSAST